MKRNLREKISAVFVPGAGSEEFKIRMAMPPVLAIDRSGWSATADSYQNAAGSTDGNASNLIDGDLKGYELYYSNSTSALDVNSSGWQLLKSGEFEYNGTNPIYVNLNTPCTAAQLKLKAISAKNGKAVWRRRRV